MNTLTEEKLKLPDGRLFKYWEDRTRYKKTYHVSQKNPSASDSNSGSVDAPFLTVSKAAAIAGAGDCVMVHEGVYREVVSPSGSGNSPEEMLCFCSAPGETAVISGGEILHCEFLHSTGWKKTNWNEASPYDEGVDFADLSARVYMFRFPKGSFMDVNPFGMINCNHYAWYLNEKVPAKMFHADTPEQKRLTVLRRGMIYCDGARMKQVSYYYELGFIPGSFWVEDDGLTVHIRMPDDSDPGSHLIEYTAREQCFVPERQGTSYIKLENLHFRMCGNGFPPPQRGMVSSYCGHHYLVKNCSFSDTNSLGMDLGFQCPTRFFPVGDPTGGHIVTGCTFSECGFGGLAAAVCSSEVHYLDHRSADILVAGNIFTDNCWQAWERSMEEAAIKIHHTKDSIIAGNYISGCKTGCGIWLDSSNENFAVRENIFTDIATRYGAVFLEASHEYLEVSHNIFVNIRMSDGRGGVGVYSHNCDNIKNIRNIILGCAYFGIEHQYGGTGRIVCGSGNTGYGVDFIENIISKCRHAVMQPTDKGKAEGNIYGHFPVGGYLKVGLPPLHLDLSNWQRYLGWDKMGFIADIEYHLVNGEAKGTAADNGIHSGGNCGNDMKSRCLYSGLEIHVMHNNRKVKAFIKFNDPVITVKEQIDTLIDSLKGS